MRSRLKAGLISSLLILLASGLNAEEIEKVEYSGIHLLDTGRLRENSPLLQGKAYHDSLLRMEVRRLDSLYFNIGYPGADFRADTVRKDAGWIVDISVNEGDQASIGEIGISGDNPAPEKDGIYDLRKGDDFRPDIIGRAMSRTLNSLNRGGYPFAQVWITGFNYRRDRNSVDISFSVVSGEEMNASEIIFKGISSTDTSTALLASGFERGRKYDERMLVSIQRHLNASGLFEKVEPGRVVRKGRGEAALIFPVEEMKNKNLFRGAFGFSRKDDNQYEVNGNVELSLNNIAGTGRTAEFTWVNDGVNYSRTDVNYLEPFLFSRNLSVETSLTQEVQDSLYNITSGKLKFRAPFGPAGFRISVSAAADRNVIQNSTDLSRSFRQRYGMGIEKQGGAYLNFDASMEGGRKKNYYRSRGDEFLWQFLYSLEADSEIETFRGQSVYLRLVSRGIFSQGKIHRAELFQLGGARSLRGYRENQFRGERISFLNLEYRIGGTSRVFIFNDAGMYYREDTGWQLKNGAGFGLRSVSAVGIIELSFGVAERFSLDAARIHVSLVESF